ncbi:MAG TPA: TetR/AcrR family transcriptional regulator [Ilumatobacteraceae bacterium]
MAAKRAYLHADDRRHQLLDAVSRLFVREGYSGVTMVAVAAEAGVSRRLVYDHFTDLQTLLEAFVEHRTAQYLVAVDLAMADTGTDLGASVSSVFALMLAMPAADQRAIRLLMAETGSPELDITRNRFRTRLLERWMLFADPQRIGTEIARAVLWSMASALFGLADLVAHGELAAADATTLARSLAASFAIAVNDSFTIDPLPRTP